MPVIDGVFTPRSPLTRAELHVDFLAHDNHVLARRQLVEAAALPVALRIAQRAAILGDVGNSQAHLTATLARSLDETARFGYLQAQTEIGHLRHGKPITTATSHPPAPATLAQLAKQGLPGIAAFVASRSSLASKAVVAAVVTALHAAAEPVAGIAAARIAAQRALHNGVLDLVGTTLNLGRTAGAAQLEYPPTFALRSEQLDGNTCDACENLHGEIVQFGTAEYFDLMPPNDCYGGGRCRGLYVYGDDDADVAAPEQLAA